MTEEQWRPVVGYEDHYEVSDQGRVRSLDRYVPLPPPQTRRFARGRILSPAVAKDNRRYVALGGNGPPRPKRVYVLVLQAFVGPRPLDADACHNDGDSLNDALSNLRWDTPSENHRDTVRHGRHNHANVTHCPREHLLTLPNLQRAQWANGRRTCLACHRASSNYRSALCRGLPANFGQMADEHYERIMR